MAPRKMPGMIKRKLIHGYLGIKNEVVWDIIENEIPPLLEQLRALKKAADESRIA